MPRFVDRVVAARRRRRRRPRLRLGPSGEVQAARRPGRRQRRRRRRRRPGRRPAGHHAARLPPPPAPQAPHRQARPGRPPQRRHRRRPGAAGARRHRRARPRTATCSPTWSAPAPSSWSPPAARAASATRRWPRPGARPPASRCWASRARPATSCSSSRRSPTWPGRLPERRQVQPGRRDVGGPAEDRRLPVHHAGAEPGRRAGRGRALHRRRRARPDPGRQPRARASAWSSCGTSSAAPRWCT